MAAFLSILARLWRRPGRAGRTRWALRLEPLDGRFLPSFGFVPAGTFPLGGAVSSVAEQNAVVIGDFSGDGLPDLGVATSSGVSVLAGSAGGGFGPAILYPGSFGSLAAGNFDGANGNDLVALSGLTNRETILFNGGQGVFQSTDGPVIGATENAAATSVAVGDLNGDGRLDQVVTNLVTDPGNVAVLLGNGDGTFQAPVGYSADGVAQAAVLGDFNGDGRPDLAVASYDPFTEADPRMQGHVSIFFNNGDGTFTAGPVYQVGLKPYALTTTDLNGDGRPDLAVVNANSDSVSVLLGTGDGAFGTAAAYPAGGNPRGLVAGDFDGDGHVDLATVDYANHPELTDYVTVLPGRGDGTFRSPVSIGTGDAAPRGVALAAADLNGDGRPDLAVVNQATNSVTILFDRPNHPPVANDQSVTTAEDVAVNLSLSATDADGDPLDYVVVDGPVHGILSGTGADRTYTPDPNYNGPDSFTFRAFDGIAYSDAATITISVTPVNDPPALSVSPVRLSDDGVTFVATGTDPDGTAGLTYSLVGAPVGATIDADGTFRWVPTRGQAGQFAFTVRVTDPAGATDQKVVAVATVGVVNGDVWVLGTTGNDRMTISSTPAGLVTVALNGRRLGRFQAGAGGHIVAYGFAGNDVITVRGPVSAEISGGAGNDLLTGGFGDDVLLGGAGRDTLRGGAGDDALVGGSGNDTLAGGAGSDILIGGEPAGPAAAGAWSDPFASFRAASAAWGATRATDPDLTAPGGVTDTSVDVVRASAGSDWYVVNLGDRIPGLASLSRGGDELSYV